MAQPKFHSISLTSQKRGSISQELSSRTHISQTHTTPVSPIPGLIESGSLTDNMRFVRVFEIEKL
jgi:hypothetical protein